MPFSIESDAVRKERASRLPLGVAGNAAFDGPAEYRRPESRQEIT